MNRVKIEQKMEQFAEHCRSARIAATPQRLAVYRELAGSFEHPSAEFIHRRVREKIPSISLDTVYRTLRFFETQGLIERIGFDGERVRFDADTTRHAHFLCKQCGTLADLALPETRGNGLPHPTEVGGVIHSVHLEYRGLCQKCTGPVRKAG